MNNYCQALSKEKDRVIASLTKKKIHDNHLIFGGEGKPPEKKPRVPTDSQSEFLANRAMGDWAEGLIAAGIHKAWPDRKAIQYGDTGSVAAGEEGFKKLYLTGKEEVRLSGKRPDLLIVPDSADIPVDISMIEAVARDDYVQQAVASLEIRSSKYKAMQYMAVRAKEKEDGKKPSRDTPSFTVKVEDLKIVYRWIEKHGVTQSYCQVFFDSAWAINVLDIFRIIGSGTGFGIEKPAKSQLKATITIPITSGKQIGAMEVLPTFQVEKRETKLGRIDAYVRPEGGKINLYPDALKDVLFAGV